MTEQWYWLTAQTYHGTRAILVNASTVRQMDRFIDRALDASAIVTRITRAPGVHWDGSHMTSADWRRYARSINQ